MFTSEQRPESIVAAATPIGQQLPLIHLVDRDDIYLEQAEDVAWFGMLRDLDLDPWRAVAAQYYEALWKFNQAQAAERAQRALSTPAPDPETRRQAMLRLVSERATQDAAAEVLAPAAPRRLTLQHVGVDVARLRPGVIPVRLAGRPPKCFFALTKAFLGVILRGRPAEPEIVHETLISNPAFARACGFTLPVRRTNSRRPRTSVQSDVPGLRKLEQFDQIMSDRGLWDSLALDAVRTNIESGRLGINATIAHDTTHYTAYSRRTTVEVPSETEGAEPRKKSHPRTTKACRCKEREECPHPWESADAGAGTVVKRKGEMHWAHKVSTLAFAGQEILLDAVAMSDAATHDSRSVVPHLTRLFARFPELVESVTTLLDDKAADDRQLKTTVQESFDIRLVTSQNPRSRGSLTKDLPRGIEKVTRLGTPVCRAGFPMDLRGCRHGTGHFLFVAPDAADGRAVCARCPLKSECCRAGGERRHASIAFDRLPWLDPELPQLSRRHARLMAKRTVIERVHNLMKFVYGDPRLRKRGTCSVQAMLDKTLFAMHVVLAHS